MFATRKSNSTENLAQTFFQILVTQRWPIWISSWSLWTWRGLALTNDNDECYKYDDDQVQDGFIISARAFSVLSGIFGLCVLVNFVFSAVIMKSFSRERRLWTLLFLFSAFESLTLLVLSADVRIDEGTRSRV